MIATLVLLASFWCWDPVPDALGYNVYWSSSGQCWSQEVRRVVVNPMDPTCTSAPVGPEPAPGEITYITVTAFNATAESDTEHGPIVETEDLCP